MSFTNNEDLAFATRYPIRARSHDMSRIANSYTDDDLLKRHIQVVNTQTEFNKDKDKSNTHSNLPQSR